MKQMQKKTCEQKSLFKTEITFSWLQKENWMSLVTKLMEISDDWDYLKKHYCEIMSHTQ